VKQLNDLIGDPSRRTPVINDCVQLIHDEVKAKKGFTGIAVKGAFKLVLALKPTILQESVDSLLNDFVGKLQPFYEQYQEAGEVGTLSAFMGGQSSNVAESLLSITDARAQRASNKTLVKAYNSLRPKGKVHVEAAAPGIGRVLDKHIGSL